MIRLRFLGKNFIVLLSLSFVGCASGPEKPDTLKVLLAEDRKTDASEPPVNNTALDVARDDGTVPFRDSGMNRPVQVAGPRPSLPPEAIASHVTGTWIARCIMTEEGLIRDCKILKGLQYSDAHLLQILYAQKYTPVMYQGEAKRVRYTFKFIFK